MLLTEHCYFIAVYEPIFPSGVHIGADYNSECAALINKVVHMAEENK